MINLFYYILNIFFL